MAHYGWSRDYCFDEIDGAESWLWFNFAIEHENKLHGGTEIKPIGKGYIQQEVERLKQK